MFQFKWENIGPTVTIQIRNRKIKLCFCHHDPDRSIRFLGLEKFLCARCMGIIIGTIITYIVYVLFPIIPLILSGLLMVPLILDGFIQGFSSYQSNNKRRFFTGLIFGIGFFQISAYLGKIISIF